MEKEFWDQRWKNQNTGWDIGYPSDPIKNYIDQFSDTSLKILIPGAGNGYEAEYLHKKGFKNVFIIDISEHAINSFTNRYPDFPSKQLIRGDFFDHEGQYDLIFEQTFFCALHPSDREAYCEQMKKLLKPNGKLVGLLFDFPLDSGPPFGGSLSEYEERFERYFSQVNIKRAEDSIPPRQGREFWFECRP